MQTDAQVTATELEKVRKDVQTLFAREGPFWNFIEKKDVETISNRDMRVPLEIRPGGNFGHFDPDGGDMGRGEASQFEKAVVGSQFLKIGIEWTKKAEWGTSSDTKAVVNALKWNLAKAMPEFRTQLDSVLMTAGDGIVGTISAVSTAGGKDTYTLGTDGFGAHLVRFGQFVNVYPAAMTAARPMTGVGVGAIDNLTAVKIDYWDVEGKQIRIMGSPTTPPALAGDKLVLNGLAGTNPTSVYGVPYHHNSSSTGFWLGLNRANYPEVRSNRVNANGALDLPFARLALNKIGNRLGMEKIPTVIAWTHPCQMDAYEQLGQLVSIINKDTGSQGLNLYFGGNMQIAGAPVRGHYSWNMFRIDFVNKSVWGRGETLPVDFYDVDSKRIFEVRGASGGVATSQIFYLATGFNTFVTNPAATSYIDGLTAPSGY